jgi:hypothetical protein
MLSCKEKTSLERGWKRRRNDCKYRMQQNRFMTKEGNQAHEVPLVDCYSNKAISDGFHPTLKGEINA